MDKIKVFFGGDPNPAYTADADSQNYPAGLEVQSVDGAGRLLDKLEITPNSILVNGIPLAGGGGSGATWYTGSGLPNNAQGVDGDFYLRTNGDLYKKAGGSWF
jgi:hypothetical protein